MRRWNSFSAASRPERRAVFLDRDGVINRCVVRNGKPYPPASTGELEILPGVPEAIAAIKAAGFLVFVVTNQPDVRRGTQDRAEVERIHATLAARLPLDGFFTCYHDDGDACACRKPQPGLLLDAARRHTVDLARSFMVGDRWRDIDAGARAGCVTVLIDYGYAERAPLGVPGLRVDSLSAAVPWILRKINRGDLMQPKRLDQLRVKIFADGADKAGMLALYSHPLVKGFTTNPTLMRQAGITDYEGFAREILAAIPDRPMSFEVFSDDFDEMESQARLFHSWGENVYVKIPVTNTKAVSSANLVRRLVRAGIKVNVTAVMTLEQVREMTGALRGGPPGYISIFAGRIADSGRDPLPVMQAAVAMTAPYANIELIWASPRELLNIFQADDVGCHVITVTGEVLKKLSLVGKDLDEFSLDTVKMFRQDALNAGYSVSRRARAA